jgi:hypothetical protein
MNTSKKETNANKSPKGEGKRENESRKEYEEQEANETYQFPPKLCATNTKTTAKPVRLPPPPKRKPRGDRKTSCEIERENQGMKVYRTLLFPA